MPQRGPRRIARGVARRGFRRVRDGYYRVGFEREFPGKDRFESWLHDMEVRDHRGDVPLDRDSWNEQYSRAGWDFLSGVRELSHYSVVVGYGQYFVPGGSVLDVGCGAGVLHDRWLPSGYRRYVGVDISDVAVAGLRERALPDAEFVAADAETFETDERFDVVVFNESITYFADPLGGFEKYAALVAPGGVVVVSCHEQSARAQAVLRDLDRRHGAIDATVVRQGGTGWRVAVFRGSEH